MYSLSYGPCSLTILIKS